MPKADTAGGGGVMRWWWLPFLLSGWPWPTLAQDIPEVDKDESIRTMHKVAECIVSSSPKQWSTLLSLVPGSEEEQAHLVRLKERSGRCLGIVVPLQWSWDMAALSFDPAVVRGPVAEALLKRYPALPSKRRTSLEPPFDMAKAASTPGLNPRTRTLLIVIDVADCVYRGAPAEAAELFATKPASEAERKVVNRLSARLGPCLTSGLEFKINRFLLRGALAEAAYRRAAGAAPAPVDAAN
jgi:hypothetical protein